jgi:hypothetical protein
MYTIYSFGTTLCVVTSFMSWEAMSNSNSNKFVTNLQTIHDQQIVRSFNNPSSQPFPQVGYVILKLVGFGVVIVVGFNLAKNTSWRHCHQNHT